MRRLFLETMKDSEGIALIATLILGMVAISFTLTMFYMTREGSRMSGVEARYQAALEAAKGGADIMINFVLNYQDANSEPAIYSTKTVHDAQDSYNHHYPDTGTSFVCYLGNYRVNVRIARAQAVTDPSEPKFIYSIVSSSTNTANSNERATVEVLYKVQISSP